LKYYTSSVWASISAGIASVAGDTSPQLAGTLDGQNNNMTNIGTISGSSLQLGSALNASNNNMTNVGTISGTNLQLDFGGL
jgi:hypothetical protein